MSRRRIQRHAFMVLSVCPIWFRSRVERGTEIVAAAASVNQTEEWYLSREFSCTALVEEGREFVG